MQLSSSAARLLIIAAITMPCSAQMMVDDADSLNFESFHKDRKEAIKVWKDDTKTIRTYEPTTTGTTPEGMATPTSASNSTPADTEADDQRQSLTTASKTGQRFEIRERYALERSAKTPYSAFYVIESLHKQSAQLCSKGWKKLTERSEPVEQDFYMFYEIECL